MATSYLEELKKKQQEQPVQQQETGLRGVSTNTQQQLNNYNQGYKPNETVQNAQQNMQTVQAQKPQSYSSKYGAALDNILAEIQNPKAFKYEFNSDNLFKSYADLMTQNARQASQNAMGQAAGLTGGYGNSYAMAAGNQAYQEAIRPLYDRGMELAALARQNYDKDRADLYNQMGALQGMDEADYNRYRDTVADWRQDEANAMDMYRDERNFGYQDYMNMLDYWNNQARAENADYQAGQQMDLQNAQFAWQQDTDARDYAEAVRRANLDEDYRNRTFDESVRQANLDEEYRNRAFDEQVRQADLDEAYRRDSMVQNQQQFETTTKMEYDQLAEKIRQFDASMSEDQRQYNAKMAASWVTDILANGQIPSMELLAMAGLSYEDAQKLVAILAPAGGGAGGETKDTTKNKEIVKNTGNYLDELGKNIIYNVGNGAGNWMMNYMGFGDTADELASIASGQQIDPKTNRAYTDRKKADAAEAAKIMYGMQDQYDANRNKVDAYANKVKNSATDGEGARLMTAEESAEYIKELRKKGLIK